MQERGRKVQDRDAGPIGGTQERARVDRPDRRQDDGPADRPGREHLLGGDVEGRDASCSTRSPGPSAYAAAAPNARFAIARCVTTTPSGAPVDPEVYTRYAGSSARGDRGITECPSPSSVLAPTGSGSLVVLDRSGSTAQPGGTGWGPTPPERLGRDEEDSRAGADESRPA